MREKITPTKDVVEKMEFILNIASDATRLKILFSLIDDTLCTCGCSCCGHCEHRHCMIEKCVGDIMKDVDASQSLISHQLKVLKDADLVSVRKEGTKAYYSLKDGHIKELLEVVYEHVMEEEEEEND